MLRILTAMVLVAVLAAPVGLALWAARPALAEDGQGDNGGKSDETKKVDNYLGIDWSDESGSKEDADKKQPDQQVDLAQTLSTAQQKRLDKIKEDAKRAESLREMADKAYRGEDKRNDKVASIRMYENAGKAYRKPILNIARLAKQVQDENVKLTLLREYQDKYVEASVGSFCKAAEVTVELSKTINDLKRAVVPLKLARQVDKESPAIKRIIELLRNRANEMMTELRASTGSADGGGGVGGRPHESSSSDTDREKEDPRKDYEHDRQGTEDYRPSIR